MRILFLKPGDPFRASGANNFYYVLAEGFIRRGWDAYFIGGYGTLPNTNELISRFDVYNLPKIATLTPKKPLRLYLWYLWKSKGQKVIKELNPDILISDGALPIPYINGLKVLRIHDIPKGLRILNVKFLLNRYD